MFNSPVVCSSICAIDVNKCRNFELVLGRSSRLTCSQVICSRYAVRAYRPIRFSRVTNSLLAYFCHLSVYICTFSYKQVTNSTKMRPQTQIRKQIKSSMASCAPNARSLDCERLEHDPDDERARSTLPFIWVNDGRQKYHSKRSGTLR